MSAPSAPPSAPPPSYSESQYQPVAPPPGNYGFNQPMGYQRGDDPSVNRQQNPSYSGLSATAFTLKLKCCIDYTDTGDTVGDF